MDTHAELRGSINCVVRLEEKVMHMPKKAQDIITEPLQNEIHNLKLQLAEHKARLRSYYNTIEKISSDWRNEFVLVTPKPKKIKSDYGIRVIVADVHGSHVDTFALGALLDDLSKIGHLVTSGIFLGDILDCGGVMSRFQKASTYEFADTYKRDVSAANQTINKIMALTPNATWDYVEGNHEWHVERFAANTFPTQEDANFFLEMMGPKTLLGLEKRGINYYKTFDFYDGLGVQGTIKRGKCYFTHGFSHAKHAAHAHLIKTGNNIVYGDTHKAQSHVGANVEHPTIGAWCPGCLCKLQPIYGHGNGPTGWSHGYGLQFYRKGGEFMHWNVTISKGRSMVTDVSGVFK